MLDFFDKKEKGSLTVEATLVLPIVIVTLLFVANILNICMVHVCMQQALNNTAKKISQDSYLVYRFAGEKTYEELIDDLSKINDDYDIVENDVDVMVASLSDFQTSAKSTINSFKNFTQSFSGEATFFNKLKKLAINTNDLIDKSADSLKKANGFAKSMSKLYDDRDKIKTVFIKLLIDTGTGAVTTSISHYLFETYRNELNISASRITEIMPFNSSLNPDGSVTMVVSYLYENPFSFVNSDSWEYSVINKEIRMTNAITVKPFIGRNGTSFIKGNATFGDTIDDNEQEVWIPGGFYEPNSIGTYCYHSKSDCRRMNPETARHIKLSSLSEDEMKRIKGPCQNCKPDGDYAVTDTGEIYSHTAERGFSSGGWTEIDESDSRGGNR